MSQYLRGRALPIALAAMAAGGIYWSGGRTNRDPLPMKGEISEKLEAAGKQGGLPGQANIEERSGGRSVPDFHNPKFISKAEDAPTKRSSTKTTD